jgi:hypothetical protein
MTVGWTNKKEEEHKGEVWEGDKDVKGIQERKK